MTLELTSEEIDLLREVAESAYNDLREEIYKTEDTDYKKPLKRREALFESILKKLSAASCATPLAACSSHTAIKASLWSGFYPRDSSLRSE